MKSLLNEWQKGFVGPIHQKEIILACVLAKGHILIEGPPGQGKTTFAQTIAKSIDGKVQRMQFTTDTLPSDITGIKFFHPGKQAFEIKYGPIFTNIFLADEINRANPKAMSGLLQAMQENEVTIDDETLKLPDPLIVIATQNNIDHHQGTYALPQATLDRFMIKVIINYPSQEDEATILLNGTPQINAISSIQQVIAHQQKIDNIEIHHDLITFITQLLNHTRNHPQIITGLSTRCGKQLIQMAKAYAYIQNRSYVILDDIHRVAPYVMYHKLNLKQEASTFDPHTFISRLLGDLNAPL